MDLITPAAGLLFWMTLIFAVVFFILAKFGFPVITGMVRKRQDHITASLRDARSAEEKLAGMQQTCEKMLEDTRREQEVLLDKANAQARQIVEDAHSQAAREAQEIVSSTARQLESMKQEALKDMQSVVADLAVSLSEKILREKLSSEAAHIDFVERLIDEQRNRS